MTYEERLRHELHQRNLPDYMHEGTILYLVHGYPPGDFLSAVICNDLKEAVAHADSSNARALIDWVKFFYNVAPINSWGSEERMGEWIASFREPTTK